MSTMTAAQIAVEDQAQAKEREFDRKAAKGARLFLALVALPLAGYSWLGINGLVPLPDWAPMGNIVQTELPAPDRPVVELPEGWEPAVPVPDDIKLRGPSTDI